VILRAKEDGGKSSLVLNERACVRVLLLPGATTTTTTTTTTTATTTTTPTTTTTKTTTTPTLDIHLSLTPSSLLCDPILHQVVEQGTHDELMALPNSQYQLLMPDEQVVI